MSLLEALDRHCQDLNLQNVEKVLCARLNEAFRKEGACETSVPLSKDIYSFGSFLLFSLKEVAEK